MLILGFNCNIHNSSAAIIKDGKLIAATEEERFNRIKHYGGFPKEAINYCLKEAKASINDVDEVVFYWQPFLGLHHRAIIILKNITTAKTYFSGRSAGQAVRGGSIVSWWKQYTMKRDFIKRYNFKNRFHYIPHHLCHAASTFLISGFDEAAILSIDFAGEWSSTLYGVGEETRIKVIKEIGYPHSLGNLYGTMTQFLGFKPNSDEYKVMGLASYGENKDNPYIEFFKKFVRWYGDGRFELDLKMFTHHRGEAKWYSESMEEILGPARKKDDEITTRHMLIAYAAQKRTEEIILEMARYLKTKTGKKYLCLAGGVALNCVANSRVLQSGIFEDIHIHPAAHDAGASVGGAFYLYNTIFNYPRNFILQDAYLGPSYSDIECKDAVSQSQYKWKEYNNIEEIVAKLIATGNIVGWFQGRMEWGPRALGNRSILADPRKAEMKEIINRKVKHREPFRPFAPTVLSEDMSEYFDGVHLSPFMLLVYKVKKPDIVPAITHVDGTGRVQTINKQDNPKYYKLIEEFKKLTGVPMVLNTSFNDAEEPIVNTPSDALSCFERTDIDYLVLHNILVSRSGILP
ncbi:MAG: carbamoyltransferase [Candidatus Hydrogenedentota bacterium]